MRCRRCRQGAPCLPCRIRYEEDDRWWDSIFADKANAERARAEAAPRLADPMHRGFVRLAGERSMTGAVMLDDPAADWS